MTIRTNIATTAFALAIACSGVSAAVPAMAADRAASVEIDAKGYDLTSPDGVARLRGQARRAASSVCWANGNSDLSALTAQKSCFRKAAESIESQIETLRHRKGQAEGQVVASANITSVPPVTK